MAIYTLGCTMLYFGTMTGERTAYREQRRIDRFI
jgi:hypothetical protein